MMLNKLETLLVIPLALLVASVSGQEESSYGAPNFSSDGGDFSGPSGGSGGSGPSGQGRVVGNSVLEFDQPDNEHVGRGQQGHHRGRQQLGFPPGKQADVHNGIDSVDDRDHGSPSGSGGGGHPGNPQDQKIYRFVSVHVAPPESPLRRSRPSQPPPKPETHYQIVFIKAPSPLSQELQELQLPPPPETKTLVYLLMKKPEQGDLLKLTQRQKPKPSKPEVFFIRYKQGSQQERRAHSQQQKPGGNAGKPHGGGGAGGQQQQPVGGGGYETSDSTSDPDFNYDNFNESGFSPSQHHQRALPEFSYTPSAQYGISG